ncbi:E3 ubiquitin-protein ligase CCNB1IP1-like isoform X2 [Diadema setosum]|uniref:E3 ubiquitin-protein ligase CCNB1IP1-like isoform X2 n=1 Tax=Diadema setosum TaxID=31175 RepID=UPI003B3AF98D
MEDMVCNYRKCRKTINSNAWVTSCSHIFCDEHGSQEFNKKTVCPACDTNLPGKLDILRIDLSPSEQYKSMVLAGQRPEVILEICSRAVAFWTYQIHQERTYQDYVATKVKERSTQVEQYYEQLLSRTRAEASSLKAQVTALKKEIEMNKKRYHDISEKLMERSRQYQKLQLLYDAMRRKSITVSCMDALSDGDIAGGGMGDSNFELPFSTIEGHRRPSGDRKIVPTTAEREFVLNPAMSAAGTPSHLALDQEAVHNRFNLQIGTPTELSRRSVGQRRL